MAKLSLRSKLVITLTFIVFTVSTLVVVISSSMVVEDKQAYLYDNVMTSLESSSSALEIFLGSKRNLIQSYRSNLSGLSRELESSSITDPDLFRASIYKNRADADISEGAVETIYQNSNFVQQYRSQEDSLFIDLKEVILLHGQNMNAFSLVEKILLFPNKAPRLLFILYHPQEQTHFIFEYLLDRALEKILGKSSLEMALLTEDGKEIYFNKPNMATDVYRNFFKNYISELSKTQTNRVSSGVSEVGIEQWDYILGHKRIMGEQKLFLFSGVKREEAFKVTTLLILNTIVYALGFAFLFNIVSVFLARSITTPLNKLTETTQKIADGDFDARLEEQKTQELDVVAQAFNIMIEKINEYNEQLKEYSRTLEQKVEARTIELREANKFIKTVVDSVGQGLLVFDREGRCLDLYTRACEKLLGVTPGGQELAQVVKAPDPEMFKEWVNGLFEEMIPFESLVELGPKSIPTALDYRDDKFQHTTLEFFPIRNEEEQIENVVMVATDKTREFRAAKNLKEQQDYVLLVSKVARDKLNFLRFTEMFTNSMNELINHMQANKSFERGEVMRLLHSMKGSAGFYALSKLVSMLHQLESDISQSDFSPAQLEERLLALMLEMDNTLELLKDFIPANSVPVIEVEESNLRLFFNALAAKRPKLAQKFAEFFLQVPAEKYLEPYKMLCMDLAQRLGKKINPLMIANGKLKIDLKFYQPFFDSCIHLFRNALDHGIETPAERLASNKNEVGSIRITFQLVPTNGEDILAIHIQDDGRGIDANRIRKKMSELNYSEEAMNAADDKIIEHIFDESFSTAETVTDLSGRGVGLYDLKSHVLDMGGRLEIKTKVGQGTLFSFYLPYC